MVKISITISPKKKVKTQPKACTSEPHAQLLHSPLLVDRPKWSRRISPKTCSILYIFGVSLSLNIEEYFELLEGVDHYKYFRVEMPLFHIYGKYDDVLTMVMTMHLLGITAKSLKKYCSPPKLNKS